MYTYDKYTCVNYAHSTIVITLIHTVCSYIFVVCENFHSTISFKALNIQECHMILKRGYTEFHSPTYQQGRYNFIAHVKGSGIVRLELMMAPQ